MNLSRNNFVPQFVPHQMVNTALPYNEPSSFVGKVLRIRPNVYEFVCDYCMSQHRSIDNFLRHTETHFQHNEISNAIPSTMAPVPNPNAYMATVPIHPAGTPINSNAPYPVQLQQNRFDTPIDQESGYTDEVYEIVDLGYDFDGKYPNAIAIDENGAQRSKPKRPRSKPKIQQSKSKVQRSTMKNPIGSANENTAASQHRCSFCDQDFTRKSSLLRHLEAGHAKIFKKIVCQKKAYKCKICGIKFPKTTHTMADTQQHLKIHYNNK